MRNDYEQADKELRVGNSLNSEESIERSYGKDKNNSPRGVSNIIGNFAKVISLDYNRDGYLDVYLGGYFHEDHNLFNLTTIKIMHNDFEKARNGGTNVMLRNNGDGTFTDVTEDRYW